jgi:sarcosine oxidase subunit alpha
VTGVDVAPLSGGAATRLDCDLVAVSGGWNPAVHLFSQARGKLRYDEALAAFLPETSPMAVTAAGAANGRFHLSDALADGHTAGVAAAVRAGFAAPSIPAPHTEAAGVDVLQPLWAVRPSRKRAKCFVDLQNDVTVNDIALAAREGYQAVEHLKRYTTLGMGTDQGKTSNIVGLAIMAEQLGVPIPQVGTTTFRPRIFP